MPRHNRRAPERGARPLRTLNHAERADLARFAREHIAEHLANVEAWAALDEKRGDPSLCVTGSEHPRTGIRLLSAGDCLDRHAVKLAGPSDAARNVAA